jgi:hypothetical protein
MGWRDLPRAPRHDGVSCVTLCRTLCTQALTRTPVGVSKEGGGIEDRGWRSKKADRMEKRRSKEADRMERGGGRERRKEERERGESGGRRSEGEEEGGGRERDGGGQ